MTRALALLSLAGCLALLAPACDYDAAWQTWCAKNHCDGGGSEAGDGGVALQCDGCGALGDVCVALDNAAACKKTCTGFSSCEGLDDCKPVPSTAQGLALVAACVPSGSSTELCVSALDCAAGYTCIKDPLDVRRCVEVCTPFKGTCSSAALACSFGEPGFQVDWGYCR